MDFNAFDSRVGDFVPEQTNAGVFLPIIANHLVRNGVEVGKLCLIVWGLVRDQNRRIGFIGGWVEDTLAYLLPRDRNIANAVTAHRTKRLGMYLQFNRTVVTIRLPLHPLAYLKRQELWVNRKASVGLVSRGTDSNISQPVANSMVGNRRVIDLRRQSLAILRQGKCIDASCQRSGFIKQFWADVRCRDRIDELSARARERKLEWLFPSNVIVGDRCYNRLICTDKWIFARYGFNPRTCTAFA